MNATRSTLIAQSVEESLDRRDWTQAVALVAQHWPDLFDDRPETLDRALREVSAEAFQADPRAAAVRDIRMHASADAVDRVLGGVRIPDPTDVDALRAIARTDRALQILSVAASRMIALRVRGRMTRAIALAGLIEQLGEVAAVHQPGLVGPRLPVALLQAGITRGLADDLPGAVHTLRAAHERAPQSRSSHVARDAAGKSALFLALSGEIAQARRWLDRHDDAPTVVGAHQPRVELSARIARSLIATESCEQPAADEAVDMLEQPATSEQSWAPVVSFAIARHALVFGDRLGAIDMLVRDRRRYADWIGDGTTLGPLLAHAEADLRLSVGEGRRAAVALGGVPEHPMVTIAGARTALHAGEHADALRIAEDASEPGGTSRLRMEVLAVQASAHLRLSDRDSAVVAYEHLSSAVRRTGARLAVLAVNVADRRQLGAEESVPDGVARELFPPLAEPIRLTPQQRMVLDGLDAGLGLKEIALAAHVTYNTVKTHAAALYRRLEVTTRAEAVATARERGLL